MKKKLITVMAILLIPALLFSGCFLFQKDGVALIQKDLGLDASSGDVQLLLNTRKDGGAGLSFVSVTFPDNAFSTQLASHGNFHALPFNEELTKLLYDTEFLVDKNGELLFPYADNGYYYFNATIDDAPSTAEGPSKNVDLSVALYDADTNQFYYCRLDIDDINVNELESMVNQLP